MTPATFCFSVPEEFTPHPLLRGAHRQTIAPFLLNRPTCYQATPHEVALADGDRIILHDDCPDNWSTGDRIAILVHGLAGCHSSPYIARLAGKLCQIGVRSLRMDMRGCGAGMDLAQGVFHADRADDLLASAQWTSRQFPASQITLCGFSLGANLTLKMLGKFSAEVPSEVDSAIAISPPIDLGYCCQRLREGLGLIYDVYFARLLWRDFCQRRHRLTNANQVKATRQPSGLLQFDEQVTTPLAGFSRPQDYYDAASARDVLHLVQVPTAIVSADDDPIVRREIYQNVSLASNMRIFSTSGGGHLGFVAAERTVQQLKRAKLNSLVRWMDDQIVCWIKEVDAWTKSQH